MALHDLGIVERRLEKLDMTVSAKGGRPGEREAGQREQALLKRVHKLLEDGQPLRDHVTDGEEVKALSNFGLLTLKPVLILVNLDEEDVPRTVDLEAEYRDRFGSPSVGAMCARLEVELGELEPGEAAEFRRAMGATEPDAPRILTLAQQMLGLITFFTLGDNECRAWPLPAGTVALEAAGCVHSDIERGFIRAEVIRWDEFLAAGGFAEAKKHGRLRSEGKQYVVQDGDVLHVLFSV